jgi:hypothetical protein
LLLLKNNNYESLSNITPGVKKYKLVIRLNHITKGVGKMNNDIFKVFQSKSITSTSLNLSRDESISYGNEFERNSLLNLDLDNKFDFIQDKYGIISSDLNIFNLDNNASFSVQDHNFLNNKRNREISDIENDNFVGDKKEEIKTIKTKMENKEDKFFIEKFGYNGNNTDDKELIIEIKEEEEKSKNKENDNEIKLLRENGKKRMFKIEKVRKEDREKNTQYGRKKQEDKDKGKNGDHNRDSEDNKMRKIKSFFGKNLYIFLRDSFSDKKGFLKLEISINKNLKKDFNEDLFNMKIKDIYFNYQISDKYVHYDRDINKKLIDKIYKEQKETAVIKILNLTYIEAFDIFRRKIMGKDIKPELKSKINGTGFLDNKKFKDFDCFIGKIRQEEKKNSNGDIEEYINDIKRLCIHFEDWFGQKIGRNRKDNAEKRD